MSGIGNNPYANMSRNDPKPAMQPSRFKNMPYLPTGLSKPTDLTYNNITLHLHLFNEQYLGIHYEDVGRMKMLVAVLKFGKTWMHHTDELLSLIEIVEVRVGRKVRELEGVRIVMGLIREARFEEAEIVSLNMDGAVLAEEIRLAELAEEEKRTVKRVVIPAARIVPGAGEMIGIQRT